MCESWQDRILLAMAKARQEFEAKAPKILMPKKLSDMKLGTVFGPNSAQPPAAAPAKPRRRRSAKRG